MTVNQRIAAPSSRSYVFAGHWHVHLSGVKIDLTAASTSLPSGAISTSASDIRCLPPRGFKSVKVAFPADMNFTKCFFIAEAQYNALPKGQRLNAQLTIKGDSNLGYVITLFRLQ